MGVARFTTILLAAVICPFWAGAEIEEGQEDLLRSVIRHNKAARERIHSYVIEQEWTSYSKYRVHPSNNGETEDIKSRHKMKIVRDRGHYYMLRTGRLEALSGTWSENRRYECALNDSYYAEYIIHDETLNSARVVEHASLDTMDPATLKLATEWYPKPCAVDFLTGGRVLSVSDSFANSPAKTRWSISDHILDGDPVYRIERVLPLTDGRELVAHFYIDPHRDFLSRGADAYERDGSMAATMRIELSDEWESRKWFPKKILLDEMHDGSRLEMEVVSVQFNPEIDKSLFTFESFDIQPNAILTRSAPGGRSFTNYRYVDGVWTKL